MAFKLWPTRAGPPAMLDAVLRPSHDVLATAQGEAVVLLDLRSERYYTLNETGSRAWTLLGRGATYGQIVETLRREYDALTEDSGDTVEEDVARLLADLLAAGLVIGNDFEKPRRS